MIDDSWLHSLLLAATMHGRRRKSVIEFLSNHLHGVRDWMRRTDLHGYKYLAEPNRVLLDRFLWAIVLLAFIIGTLYVIISSLLTFFQAPTAISELPIKRPVTEMYFPAVTVCHPSRFSQKRLSNLTDFV